MKFTNYAVIICSAWLIVGCQRVALEPQPTRHRFKLQFQEDTVQTYRLVSHRDVEIQWEPDDG